MAKVHVGDRQVRGYWITGLGQRVEEWVPMGDYGFGNAANVDGLPIVALVNGNGFAWHIPEFVFRQLPRV